MNHSFNLLSSYYTIYFHKFRRLSSGEGSSAELLNRKGYVSYLPFYSGIANIDNLGYNE